jgi:hypothetical protein
MDGADYRRFAKIEVAELTYNSGSEKEERDLDLEEMVGPLHNFHASAGCGVARPPSISDIDPEGRPDGRVP